MNLMCDAMDSWKYRPEIDGLRAVAVLLVVLFHADLGFQGGFIGVDIFFVISGFLITGLIFHRQQQDKFRLADFWNARIRRILPASMLMVALTLAAAAITFMPQDYEFLAKAAFFHQCLIANIYLWLNSSYFDVSAELNPLLHTWSLAVEEQFYLIYPFLLVWLRKFRESTRFWVLAGLFLLSLTGSEYIVRHDQSFAFFMLPTRAWEMLLGGLICFLPNGNRHRKASELFSAASIVGLLLCAWIYHDEMIFPGVSATLPCVLTAIFISLNSAQVTLTGRILSSKPFVFVGLISYSLYLAHWPILTFLRYQHGRNLSLSMTTIALTASFAIAVLSWRFVEQPFRHRIVLRNQRQLIAATILVPSLLITISLVIDLQEGIPARLPHEARIFIDRTADQKIEKLYELSVKPSDIEQNKVPVHGDRQSTQEILIWGDSHAMALMPGIDAVCKVHKIKCHQITYPGNTPLLNFSPPWNAGGGNQIVERNRATCDFIIRNKIPLVIMVAYWGKAAEARPQLFRTTLKETISTFEKANVQVVIWEDSASFDYLVPNRLAVRVWRDEDISKIGVPLRTHLQFNHIARESFQSLPNQNVRIYDPTPYFTAGSDLWHAQIDGVAMIRDYDHLSVAGSLHLKPLLEKAILKSYPLVASGEERRIY